jgi:hypothetical protein
MPRRFGRWIAVLVASSVALLAPVPMLTPAAEAAEPKAPAVLTRYLNQNVTWADCSGDFESQCATVAVPMDWQNPARGDIRIAIAYLAASGASKGLLTSNPGGPGAAGRMLTEALSMPSVTGQGGKPQLRQYDLLGFDPRGFGASTNVKCLTTRPS